MSVEERVNSLEGEFKLIKGEMRQSLIDVRDFLITMKMPSLADDTIPAPKQETEASKDLKDEPVPGTPPPAPPQFQQPETAQQPADPVAEPADEGPKGWQPPEDNDNRFAPPPQPQDSQPQKSWDQPAAPPAPPFLPFPEIPTPQPSPPAVPQVEDYHPPKYQHARPAMPERAPAPQVPKPEERPYVPPLPRFEERSPMISQPKHEERPDNSFQQMKERKPCEVEDAEGEYRSTVDTGNIKEIDMAEEKGNPVGKGEEKNGEAKGTGGKVTPLSQINMLANLARWVSVAKAQIGIEQLPLFLDLYGTAGPMPAELKDIVLRLGQVVGQQSGQESSADVWSRLTLELHGILGGGGVPELIAHMDEAKEKVEEQAEEETLPETDDQAPEPEPPVLFKIVLPTGKGSHKEYALNLGPEVSGNGAKSGNGHKPKG